MFEFIDWVMQLNDEEENLIWEEIKELEEVKRMPYVTSVERIGMKIGMEKGMEKGREEGRYSELVRMVRNVLVEKWGREMAAILGEQLTVQQSNIVYNDCLHCLKDIPIDKAIDRQHAKTLGNM